MTVSALLKQSTEILYPLQRSLRWKRGRQYLLRKKQQSNVLCDKCLIDVGQLKYHAGLRHLVDVAGASSTSRAQRTSSLGSAETISTLANTQKSEPEKKTYPALESSQPHVRTVQTMDKVGRESLLDRIDCIDMRKISTHRRHIITSKVTYLPKAHADPR